MPARTKTRIPVYRHHKPSGLASVRLDGRDIYLGRHGTSESRSEYQRVIAEWLSNRTAEPGAAKSKTAPSERIVDELSAAYLDFAKTYYVKNSALTGEYRNIGDAMRPLTALYGRARVCEFGPSELKAVRQAMIDSNLCRRTINNRINRIRRVFKWGVENEFVSAEILHALQAVAPLKLGRCNVREAEPVKPVPEHQIEPVLKLVAPQVAAMIRLQLLTGMRPGEVMQMRACDIDISGPIWVYQAMAHIHRGRRAARQTPMTPSQAVRKRKRFPRRAPGDCYDRRSYAWAIRRACDAAFPPAKHLKEKDHAAWCREHRWSPNQLRHNAATELRKQFGIEAARVVLGHSSADVTEIYAELDLAKAAEIMSRVG
ncbi:MAG: site-specific integrase [Planctomycetes bacterium]|nr:site-specific integrase [Planctomycetota bacterium]